jgi:Tfp pilus assembly protein PilX
MEGLNKMTRSPDRRLSLPLTNFMCRNENGVALIIGLMFLVIIALAGTTAVILTSTDLQIGGNYKASTQAFYIADAGLEIARDQLRTNIEASTTVSQMLSSSVGGNGALSDSTSTAIFTNFYANGTFLTDDVPLIAQTTFSGGTYRVYLTNDSVDGVTTLTDTNNQVTLTSFGHGPDNSLTILQEVVQRLEVPPIPGAVVLPGPDVIFDPANSNVSGIAGDTESALSLTSDAAEATVETELTDIGRINNYTCEEGAGSVCINNDLAEFDPRLTTVADIESLADTFRSAADTDLPGPGPYSLTADQVGNTSDRKIVYVDGDATLGPVNGAGVLIVTGTLTLSGNFNYNGFIMCIGEGKLLRAGSGNGEINGAIFVAKTRDDAGNLLSELGEPTFDTSGGGNSDIRYDATQLREAAGTKFLKKSWQEI